jgi:hypothetical protein
MGPSDRICVLAYSPLAYNNTELVVLTLTGGIPRKDGQQKARSNLRQTWV